MMPRFAYSASVVQAAEEKVLKHAAVGVNGASPLMEAAAAALATAILDRLKAAGPSQSMREAPRSRGAKVVGRSVLLLVGGGNNGADALYAGVRLARRGVQVTAVQCAGMISSAGLEAFKKAGGRHYPLVSPSPEVVNNSVATGELPPVIDPSGTAPSHSVEDVIELASRADIVVDAMLGIGARGGLRAVMAELAEGISALREASATLGQASPEVAAVDVPSGIGIDDGSLPGPVLPADETLTFGVAKPGLWLPPAAAYAGQITVVDLGLFPAISEIGALPIVERFGPDDVSAWWPQPKPDDNKYSRGVLGVVAGSDRYPGAAVLVTGGAMESGVGLLRYVGRKAARNLVHRAYPEAVAGSGKADAWTVGSGVSLDDIEQVDCVRDAIGKARRGPLPIVIDAGGLSVLPAHLSARIVLTPHSGELVELLLAREIECTAEEIDQNPFDWVRRAAELYGATVLLKGPTTLIATPAGRVIAVREATPWLATAGAGDVLAGIMGAVFAGNKFAVRESADVVADLSAVAVVVHGRAARIAARRGPIVASDVVRAVPEALRELGVLGVSS